MSAARSPWLRRLRRGLVWTEPEDDVFIVREALAALWVIEGAEDALLRMKSRFKIEGFGRCDLASTLAKLGEGEEEIRQELMSWRQKNSVLFSLGVVGAPCLPAIKERLDHKDPAIRDAARPAIAAIENDHRGQP